VGRGLQNILYILYHLQNKNKLYTMLVSDSKKQQVIWFINDIEDKFKHSKSYFKELTALKKKYIFMLIGENEYKKDLEYLRAIKEIVKIYNL